MKKEVSDHEEDDEEDDDEDEDYNLAESGDDLQDPITTASVKVELQESDKEDFDGECDPEYQQDNITDDDKDNDNSDSSDPSESAKSIKPRKRVTRQATKRKQNSKQTRNRYCSLETKKLKSPTRETCAVKCQLKCNSNIDKRQRKHLCDEFWELTKMRRWDYLLKFVEVVPTIKLSVNHKSRGYNYMYFLNTDAGERVRVCVKFFYATLSIGANVVKNAMRYGAEKGKVLKRDVTTTDCVVSADLQKPQQSNSIEEDNMLLQQQENNFSVASNDLEINEMNSSIGVATTIPAVSNIFSLPSISMPEFNSTVIVTTVVPAAASLSQMSDTATTTKVKKSTVASKRRKDPKFIKEYRPKPLTKHASCMRKCTETFTEEARERICAAFRAMDYKRRKDFVLSHIDSVQVLTSKRDEYRKTKRVHRPYHNRYYLRGQRGEKVRVCEHFFTTTLCISRFFIRNALQNVDKLTGSYTGEDKRGWLNSIPRNKTPEELINDVKRHIASYPTWSPSSKTKTRYLHSALSIRRMYREYKDGCVEEQRNFTSEVMYRRTFHKHFRLAFLKPLTKLTRKVSTLTRDSEEPSPSKRSNPNVSEFTGHEGGFWINPSGGDPRMEQYAKISQAPATAVTNVIVEPSQPMESYTRNACAPTVTTNYLPPPSQLSPPVPQLQQVLDAQHFHTITYDSTYLRLL